MLKELVLKNRSYRRYDHNEKITYETLVDFVDIARNTPSGGNKQAMRYFIVCNEADNQKVFSTLKWAGYLKDWDGPSIEERPTGYIIVLRDKKLAPRVGFDDGIVAQTITLAATEKGYGCCMIHNCGFNALFEMLGIDKDQYVFSIAIAIGKPVETVVLEDMENEQVQYYRDENQVHHVPKRKLTDIIVSSDK